MYGSNNLVQDQIRNRTNPPPNLFSIIEIGGGGGMVLIFFILIDQDCSKENLHGRKFARVVRQVENRSQSHAYYHSRQSLKNTVGMESTLRSISTEEFNMTVM